MDVGEQDYLNVIIDVQVSKIPFEDIIDKIRGKKDAYILLHDHCNLIFV